MSRVLPNCSTFIAPLDGASAGKESREAIQWTEELENHFKRAQDALSSCRSIVLPLAEERLWIVTDGSVKMQGIGATMYVIRQDKAKLAGFYSAKLRDRQVTWLPCEIEALAIAMATKHYQPLHHSIQPPGMHTHRQ